MALSTFQPFAGPMANYVYTLPQWDKNTYKSRSDIDKSGVSLQGIADGDGEYIGSGLLPVQKASGQIDAVFTFHPSWLENNGYTGDYVGAVQANFDFDTYVSQGGLGILTDTLPAGIVNTKTRQPLLWRKTNAVVYQQPEIAQIGPDYITITMTFRCPFGYWVCSDGSIQTFSSIAG